MNTGEKVSLRDAGSQIGVNNYYDDNSLTIYDRKANKYRKISEPFDSEDEALQAREEFEKQLKSEIVVQNHKPSSQREEDRWQDRKAEMQKEAKNFSL